MTRIGLFGQLGSGNIGNGVSLDAVLALLHQTRPTAVVDFLCTGHERVRERYGADATPLHWYRSYEGHRPGRAAAPLKVLGKLLDAVRTLRWVRRHDLVVVPGMGVLEATLPLRPWGFPYALFLLCLAGRLTRTPVALVGVGADVIARPTTRRLITWSARLAGHRSYRDAYSREAMRSMGVDTSADRVVPDVVFALPLDPGTVVPEPGAVGVGVMAWYGADEDRARGAELHAAYLAAITGLVRWLLDSGRRVRLLTGDRVDREVVRAIVADIRAARPGLDPGLLVADPVESLEDLVGQMAPVDTVVATRFHNVVCALRLAKPTLSVSYAAKGDALMAEMGVREFCHSARTPDTERLIAQFTALEERRDEVSGLIAAATAEAADRLRGEFAALAAQLLPGTGAVRPDPSHREEEPRVPDDAVR